MKENLKSKIEKRFSDQHFSKIILYKNPNEFTSLYIERINPNHVGILWGKRHKKFNKGSHYVKCGMVYFSWIPIVMGITILGWFDVVTDYFYYGLINIGIFGLMLGFIMSIIIYGIPLWLDRKICPTCKTILQP
jgi:hypothetical protein